MSSSSPNYSPQIQVPRDEIQQWIEQNTLAIRIPNACKVCQSNGTSFCNHYIPWSELEKDALERKAQETKTIATNSSKQQ